MTREELSTDKTFYMIQHVYNLYLQMEEKYSHLLGTEESYEFEFLNFRGTGQKIVMRPNYFSVYDETDYEYPVFEIGIMKKDEGWTEFSLSDTEFSWYNGTYKDDLCLVVGDHERDWDKRYIDLYSGSSAEEVFDEYGEEYFFQQLTVQNIIEYELFQQEVHFFYKHLLPNLLRKDIYINVQLENFNLETLEGFRVI